MIYNGIVYIQWTSVTSKSWYNTLLYIPKLVPGKTGTTYCCTNPKKSGVPVKSGIGIVYTLYNYTHNYLIMREDALWVGFLVAVSGEKRTNGTS